VHGIIDRRPRAAVSGAHLPHCSGMHAGRRLFLTPPKQINSIIIAQEALFSYMYQKIWRCIHQLLKKHDDYFHLFCNTGGPHPEQLLNQQY
jgi:hypothetical protein